MAHHLSQASKMEHQMENKYRMWKAKQPELIWDWSVDPRGAVYYCWVMLCSSACFYNMISVVMLVFEDIQLIYYEKWRNANFICDLIYLMDILVQSRLSYYAQGVQRTHWLETGRNYFYSWQFGLDGSAILFPDYVWSDSPYLSGLLRLNRVLKVHRLGEAFDLSYSRIKQVKVSLARIIIVCFLTFHWNACAYYRLSTSSKTIDIVNATFDDDSIWPWQYIPEKITNFHFAKCNYLEDKCNVTEFLFDEERESNLLYLKERWKDKSDMVVFSNLSKQYTMSMYWSALTMTTLGEQPSPSETSQSIFEIVNTIMGIVIFAAIMGSVGDLVANANKVEMHWRLLLDGMKQYMEYRNLSPIVQSRVMRYFEYELAKKETFKESEIRELLPSKLYAKANKILSWRVLQRSPLFQMCEIPFLTDLCLHLKPFDFGPGDVISSIGDLNREMFVVSSGQLQSINENKLFLQFHPEGSIIHEIGLIWFDNNVTQNRRVTSLVSTGFSEVYILNRDALAHVLEDFPYTKDQLRLRAYELQADHGEIDIDETPHLTVENLTIEERLQEIERNIIELTKTVDDHYAHFILTSSNFKRRLYTMEKSLQDDPLSIPKRRRKVMRSRRKPERNVLFSC